MPQPPALIGRDDILSTVRRELAKGRNVLLIGASGVGKSALLQATDAALSESSRVLYVAQASPTKAMLIDLAQQLHERYQALPYPDIPISKAAQEQAAGDPAVLPWSALNKPVSRMPIKELSGLCLEALRGEGPYVLILDHLERVTPSQRAVLEALFEQATIVGATLSKQSSGHLAKLWWNFKVIDVLPLSNADARQLIEAYLAANTVLIENRRMFCKHALRAANGNPQALLDILSNAGKEKKVDKTYIREEVQHDAGERYLDLTPIVLILGACIIAGRYLARGMGEADMYILSGVLSAFFMVARPFIFRGMSRGR